MEEFSALEGDMQMDVTEMEHEPPVPFIDFFARDNEVNRVNQSDIGFIDFFARENQLNNATGHVVDQREQQTHTSFLDTVPLNNHANYVGDQHAEQSDFLYYDFFNGGHQVSAAANMVEQPVWNTNSLALENQLNHGTSVVEQSVWNTSYYTPENQGADGANEVQESVEGIDYHAPENQLNAADNVGEQSVQNTDYIYIANQLNAVANVVEQSMANIHFYVLENQPSDYYAPENQLSNVVENSVLEIDYYTVETQCSAPPRIEISFADIDYNALAGHLRAAANVYEQSAALPSNSMALENHLEQSGFRIRVVGENVEIGTNDSHGLVVRLRYGGEGHPDGYSDYGEDPMSEYEPIPEDDQPLYLRPAARSVVTNLASVTFTEESVYNDTLACAICQEEFSVGQTAKELPCSHYYHQGCILPWLDQQNTCPVCRYELPIDDEDNERASPE